MTTASGTTAVTHRAPAGARNDTAHPGGPNAVRTLLIADPALDTIDELVLQLLDRRIETSVCIDGAEALLQVGSLRPDVLLVAADLPVVNGATLVQVLRRTHVTPVILGVGPGDDPTHAVNALAAGATACVARPYRLHEVLPLITAGRQPATTPRGTHPTVLEAGGLRLDRAAYEVRLHGQVIPMPLRQFELLQYLMLHADHAVTRKQIRDDVWGTDYVGGTNTIAVHVRRLRTRLGDDHRNPRILLTVRTIGYRLVPPPTT